ncbi:exported protein of unknown function [Candidatus Methylocalor cossyra]|uniref:Uncharacterized protein n=1 Tax=Candidatus Methylocalor cossyra TaxID=3108543 RepID=A0ABM9NMH6_9GAMM
MNKNLQKAVWAALGTAAMGSLSPGAMAVGISGYLTNIVGSSSGFTLTGRPMCGTAATSATATPRSGTASPTPAPTCRLPTMPGWAAPTP